MTPSRSLNIRFCVLVTTLVVLATTIRARDGGASVRVRLGSQCTWRARGRVLFDRQTRRVLGCDGRRWTYALGHSQNSGIYENCYEILKNGESVGDGFYFLTSPSSGKKYRAFCDMTLEGGGWTLFATKAAWNTASRFALRFNIYSAEALSYDASGCIPFKGWREVLFRFKSDRGASRLVFNRNFGAKSSAKSQLISAFTCDQAYKDINGPVSGFYKHTAYENQGRRTPAINFFRIAKLYLSASSGVSEAHEGSDKWIDMWSGKDSSGNNYHSHKSANSLGTKCIAGSCYQNDPIWFMYR